MAKNDKPATPATPASPAPERKKAGRPKRDPNEAPDRYFARRAAVYLGRLTGAAVKLGGLPGSTEEQRAKVLAAAEGAVAKLRKAYEAPEGTKVVEDFGL